jgi:hypothetical protein
VSWEAWGERSYILCVFSWEKEKIECVKGKLVIMCEEVLFMEENVRKKKSMEGSCV